jgi:hypothetical protein
MTPKSGRLAGKTAFSPNYFHRCKPILSVPRAIFPFIYRGFVAVGRGFWEPAFCTSGLNTRFQRHVMMLPSPGMINDKYSPRRTWQEMINERQSKPVKASQTKMAGLTQWRRFLLRMVRMGVMQNEELSSVKSAARLSSPKSKSVVQFLSSMKVNEG